MGYHVVVDLEMCRVIGRSHKYPHPHEIIQIGAALLDDSYEVIDRFMSYVKPVFGRIDSFIYQMTGISGGEVREAPSLEEALKDFAEWLPEKNVQAVSWSNTDEKQIRKEMSLKGIQNDRIHALLNCWLDCQPMFSKIMGERRRYSLEEALIASDIFTEGRAHDGLVDASNTALLFAKMKTEKDYALNPYYDKAHREEHSKPLSVSMGDLFAQLKFPLVATA